MSEKAQRAKALFLEGYNCAQAVAGAFAPEMGLSVDAAARLASGFGGGMGRMREVCGAVSGMTLAASALRGYNAPARSWWRWRLKFWRNGWPSIPPGCKFRIPTKCGSSFLIHFTTINL